MRQQDARETQRRAVRVRPMGNVSQIKEDWQPGRRNGVPFLFVQAGTLAH